MKMIRRMLSRGRVTAARKKLAGDPSPGHYAALAQEYALLGLSAEVQQVCEEGLAAFPGNSELCRLRERAQRFEREERIGQLKLELSEASRPALWNELCQLLVESGRLARAEEHALEWIADQEDDGDARVMLARVRLERFLADRGREEGQRAHTAIEDALERAPSDTRVWRLQVRFLSRLGVWDEARTACSRLLQLVPGDPVLEARFRAFDVRAGESTTVERALIDVERTGRFADEADLNVKEGRKVDVRTTLRELVSEKDVKASVYVRGSTVLVQGPRGATADRTARAVHSVVTSSRTAGRRLGLGQVHQIQMEGDFGTLAVAAGAMDAGALWCAGPLTRTREKAVSNLVGLNASNGDEVNP